MLLFAPSATADINLVSLHETVQLYLVSSLVTNINSVITY